MIRRMQEKDCKRVAQIEAEVFSEPWSEMSFLKEVNVKNHIYLVACTEHQDEIMGYCGLWEVAKEGQITNVCVAPAYRGKKVATQMLSRLLSEADKLSITATTLEVRVSNAAAIRVYEKLGFRSAGIRKGFYSEPKEDAMIMWLYSKQIMSNTEGNLNR